MNRSEELRKHAIECGQMANLLRTKETEPLGILTTQFNAVATAL